MNRNQSAALGFIIAPAIAALPFPALAEGSLLIYTSKDVLLGYLIAVLPAYAQTLFLGLPIYLLARKKMQYSLPLILLTGAVISASPWLIFLGVSSELLLFHLGITACGILGGATFYLLTQHSHRSALSLTSGSNLRYGKKLRKNIKHMREDAPFKKP